MTAACLTLTSAALATENRLLTESAPIAAVATDSLADQQWKFRVLLGKREIGFHEFRVDRQGTQTEVDINADFDVKILFINAYSYSHQNEELWRNDCLTRLESVTDDNGESNTVLGEQGDDSFVVRTPGVQFEEDAACIRSFAYWNPAFLDSERLLNSQTGEIVDVKITDEGPDAFQVNGEPVAASRYSLAMKDGTISLWYSANNGQWLALEAPAPGGRILRYEPVQLPFQTTPADKLVQN